MSTEFLCYGVVILSYGKIVNGPIRWMLRGALSRIVLICFLLCFSPLVVVAASPTTLVIEGGSVFDAISGQMQANQTVVIEGQKIKWVGGAEKAAGVPQDARVIDARGKFVIPGLIDGHVHIFFPLEAAHVSGDRFMPLFLANGVTSLRDVGDRTIPQVMLSHFAEINPDRCPRIFMSSELIDGDPPYHGKELGVAVTDPAKVRALVEDMAAWKVTTLKLYVGTQRAVGRKVIEEGHRCGLVVTGHLGAYRAQDAVADGIDCLEHIWGVFDYIIPPGTPSRADLDLNNPLAKALIASIIEKKVSVSPTLTVFRNTVTLADLKEVRNNPDNDYVPKRLRACWDKECAGRRFTPATLDARRREFRKYQELTGILYRAGVTLLAGTDTPEPCCPPGFVLHQELELLAESGLPPAAVLQAATINNARILRQDRNLGSIEAGKLADLVILQADPTADIRNTRKIDRVIRGGRVCDPKVLLRLARPAD
jgi:hypothetical protein